MFRVLSVLGSCVVLLGVLVAPGRWEATMHRAQAWTNVSARCTRRRVVQLVAGASLAGHIAGPLTRRSTVAQAAPPVRWHFPVEAEASVFRPVAGDGVVYFVFSPELDPAGPPVCRVQCLDAATGVARWSRDLPETPACGPAFDGEVVVVATGYFVNDAFAVHALDGTTGETRWRQDQADFGSETSTALGLAAFLGGLYLHRDDGTVWSLDPATGEPRWDARPAGGFGIGEPVSSGDLILTAGTAIGGVGTVGAVDASTGESRWRVELPASLLTTPAIVGDLVIVELTTATIVALEVATGTERWQVTPATSVQEDGSGDIYVSRLAGADGAVFGTGLSVEETGSLALAWDAATSAELWRTRLGDGGATPPAVDSGATYVRSDDLLIALDAATGVERWRTTLPGEPLSSSLDEDRPPVVADGTVYVAAERMGLVAVDAAL